MVAAGATSGISTSSQPLAARRSDLPSSLPSRCTPPAAAISAARVRDRPSSRDNAASTRSPTRPSGTGIARVSGILLGLTGRRGALGPGLDLGLDVGLVLGLV